MNKLNTGKRTVQCSVLKALDSLTQEGDTLKEYCCPLMKATSLEEFIKKNNLMFDVLFVVGVVSYV